MARNGSGTFVRAHDFTDDAAAAIKIRADRMDEEIDGIATALSASIANDGQTTILADLPMSTHKHTGVGNATARDQYVSVASLQDGSHNWVAAGGTADAITATYAPALTALVDGQLCFVRAGAANATTTPTFAPSGLTARTITKRGGSALAAGDIPAALAEIILRYNLANTRWELLNPAATVPQNYLSGLTLSTAGASATMTIAAGVAADSTNAQLMALTSSIAKTTSAWAVGTAAGGLDTGAIANSTWYHFYEIKRTDTGVVDVLFSLSASAPTMPTSYTLKRRIGSGKTNGSAQWTKFVQLGDRFLWDLQVADASGVTPADAAAHLVTLTVPTGVQVDALYWLQWGYNSTVDYVLVTSPDQADTQPTTTIRDFFVSTGFTGLFVPTSRRTNTSAQIRIRAAQSGGSAPTSTYSLQTFGWDDLRGK